MIEKTARRSKLLMESHNLNFDASDGAVPTAVASTFRKSYSSLPLETSPLGSLSSVEGHSSRSGVSIGCSACSCSFLVLLHRGNHHQSLPPKHWSHRAPTALPTKGRKLPSKAVPITPPTAESSVGPTGGSRSQAASRDTAL